MFYLLQKKKELNETPSEEKSDKCNSQQNTSISGSNSKSDKTKSVKSSTSKTDNKKDHRQKSVIILGNSMIKHVNGWEISRKF